MYVTENIWLSVCNKTHKLEQYSCQLSYFQIQIILWTEGILYPVFPTENQYLILIN